MKKATLAFLLATALAAPGLFAQRGPGGPPDPSKFVARRVQHLTTLLDLTPSQVTAATNAFTAAATANQTVEPQLRTAHQALKTDVEGGAALPAVQKDASTIAGLEAQILVNNATAEETFLMSLTQVQRDKLNALGREGFGGRGPGPGGFGPGGPR